MLYNCITWYVSLSWTIYMTIYYIGFSLRQKSILLPANYPIIRKMPQQLPGSNAAIVRECISRQSQCNRSTLSVSLFYKILSRSILTQRIFFFWYKAYELIFRNYWDLVLIMFLFYRECLQNGQVVMFPFLNMHIRKIHKLTF